MIAPEEIQAKADAEGIHTSNVQRDYIFSWILAGLYRQSNLANQLVLKGGNLYRKAYYPSTRFSNDLDFTTETGVDPTNLMRELNGICEYITSQTGIQFDQDKNELKDEVFIDDKKSSYKVRLYFKDFFGQKSQMTLKVNLDIAQFDKRYLPPIKTPLIHPYSDAESLKTDIMAVKLEEALADKLKCLIQRRHSFDLFDLVHAIFIDKTIQVDKTEMVQVFLKKTIFERSPGAAKNLLIGVPFDLMQAYWSKLVCPKTTLFAFEDAVGMFSSSLSGLFDSFGVGNSSELAFYPAELRNKIMDAGQNQQLLRMRYHGYTRLIEPYSLKYKVTKDGTGREYFWGFDRTGGSSGTTSIKAFLSHDVEEMVVTDEKFDPRYEIEVSKAGEIHDSLSYSKRGQRVAGILGRPTSIRTKATPRKRSRLYSGFGDDKKYIVECTACHKRFYRASQFDTTINSHKRKSSSRYPTDCYGTYGRYVGRKR
ncbi:MAG TPA: nucleotidyl transferase AbiEii/AbiGii toxin family protein [Candidatus Saccharimonadales bacterium]